MDVPRPVRVFLVVLLGIGVGEDGVEVVDFVLGSHRKTQYLLSLSLRFLSDLLPCRCSKVEGRRLEEGGSF